MGDNVVINAIILQFFLPGDLCKAKASPANA
jgi:hypothetical protein